MPTSHPASFEEPLRNSPFRKMLHPLKARHTGSFFMLSFLQNNLETLSVSDMINGMTKR
jgi:hypothetical protein